MVRGPRATRSWRTSTRACAIPPAPDGVAGDRHRPGANLDRAQRAHGHRGRRALGDPSTAAAAVAAHLAGTLAALHLRAVSRWVPGGRATRAGAGDARVSVVQVSSPPAEPVDARRTRVGAMVADAAGADLVVLPELWAPGHVVLDRYPELAEPLDGDTVSAGSAKRAQRLRCFFCRWAASWSVAGAGRCTTPRSCLTAPARSCTTTTRCTSSATSPARPRCSRPAATCTAAQHLSGRSRRPPATTCASPPCGRSWWPRARTSSWCPPPGPRPAGSTGDC